MPTTAGILLSTLLGSLARKMQVSLIGKTYPLGINRLYGYVVSSGVFIGGYLIFDHYTENNKQLLQRRLAVLREQRAQKAVFHEFENEPDHILNAENRGSFFRLMDKFGAPYK